MKPYGRKVAILGGARIPFARQNTAYATRSNQDMLTAALKGVVDNSSCTASARRSRRRRGAEAFPRLQT